MAKILRKERGPLPDISCHDGGRELSCLEDYAIHADARISAVYGALDSGAKRFI